MNKYYLEEKINKIDYEKNMENKDFRRNLLRMSWKNDLEIIESICSNCQNKEFLDIAIKNIKKLLNQYDIVFNGTQDALFLVEMLEDRSFKYIRSNDAYLEEFELKRDQMINKSPKEVFGEEIGERFSNYYKNCIDRKKVDVFEDVLVVNGNKKIFLTKLTPVLNEEDGIFVVGSREDITKRKEMESKLDRMANYDKLTNIPNVRLFFKSFRYIIKESKKMNEKFAVLFIDLDCFKKINDIYGHETGDKVLVYTARRISRCLRSSDIIGRIGGDEFAAIIRDIHDKKEVEEIVKDIQDSLRKDILIDDNICNIDSSIGITMFPVDGDNMKVLMRNSDKAMYKVKNKGKGGYKFFNNMSKEIEFEKKDGHIHTQYCPHGSDDKIENYVLEALKCGLNEMSFTEHLPLPRNFKDPSPLSDSAMSLNEIEFYLNEVQAIQKKYNDEIKINVGVEVDYIEGYEDEIRELLNKYGIYLNDSILSVHIIKGNAKYYCIDFNTEEFNNIIADLGSLEEVYNKYYDTLIMALESDLGLYKPRRIGHLNLVRKFNKEFPYNYEVHIPKIEKILNIIKEKGYELDFNVAGLRKDECKEIYLEGIILEMAIEKDIPMVLGSDSHSAKYIKCLREFL